MPSIALLLLLVLSLHASFVENYRWRSDETYLMFLARLHLPQRDLYYNLDKEDQRMTEDIRSGFNYQILYGKDKKDIRQLLIPSNDELQIHIYKDRKGRYRFEMLPIISRTQIESIALNIDYSPYYDIIQKSGSKKLATIFVQAFKHSLDFKRGLRKGDRLAMLYKQKYRLLGAFSMPTLLASAIELHKKRHFVYLGSDGRYYNEAGKQVEGFLLARPIPTARITSGFTRKRWHPILHKYRAHLGVDFGARSGTPIRAAGSGRIIFAGYTRGYGKLIKILHQDGYVTLYAHQRKFRRGIRRGRYVKKGEIIGYVGSTGLSTGAHLHFGLYKNGRAINPLRIVQVATKQLRGKRLKEFKKLKAGYDKQLLALMDDDREHIKRTKKIDRRCYCYDRRAALYRKDSNATNKEHRDREANTAR